MLTNETMIKAAKATYRTNQAMQGGFFDGAQWANEQNAVQVSELLALLLEIRAADIATKIGTGSFSIPQPLREKMQKLIEKYEK